MQVLRGTELTTTQASLLLEPASGHLCLGAAVRQFRWGASLPSLVPRLLSSAFLLCYVDAGLRSAGERI